MSDVIEVEVTSLQCRPLASQLVRAYSLDALAAACAWRGLPSSGRKHDVAARLAKSLEKGRDEAANPEAGFEITACGSGAFVLRTPWVGEKPLPPVHHACDA
mmetsp:Transcript_48534/g.134620  ORF Transcript_48534/g.134620 Transcript_48534/m.134620 type:complete len:102 (+) Transcript_48534:482-787(+)|eukprot:2408142-Prymnesium_polylepis.2